MPSQRLSSESSLIAPMYSVVGVYAGDNGNFIRHLALLAVESSLSFGNDAPVWQMGPPLVVGEQSKQEAGVDDDRCKVHLVAYTDLELDDIAGMRTWLAEIDKERRPQGLRGGIEQYTVHPPVIPVVDEISRVVRYRRFSCVGLILECYREGAGITLIDWKCGELPDVTMDSIVAIYGENLRAKAMVRDFWGIPGNGPWQVALAGYVLHSLDRPASEVRAGPHSPLTSAEGRFPVDQDSSAN